MNENFVQEYKGMVNKIFDCGIRDLGNDKKESVWKIQTYNKDNQLLGEWNYIFMRVDPHNPNPNEKFYISTIPEVMLAGERLIDKILKK
jgi:hypothetical protein